MVALSFSALPFLAQLSEESVEALRTLFLADLLNRPLTEDRANWRAGRSDGKHLDGVRHWWSLFSFLLLARQFLPPSPFSARSPSVSASFNTEEVPVRDDICTPKPCLALQQLVVQPVG